MGKQALRAKRGQYFYLPPEDLTLITDTAHPLYDESVTLPPDENIVKNMMVHGVKVPLAVRKNGDLVEVVDGRRRVINAREANARLVREGREPLLVKVIIERGSDNDHADTMILANELRRQRDPMTKARQVSHYLRHRSPEDAAIVWGVDPQTIKRWVTLLDLHPKVQTAISTGRLGTTRALKEFPSVRREDQPARLDEMSLTEPGRNGKPKQKRKKRSNRPTAKKIRDVAEQASPTVREALLWALGDIKGDELTGKLKGLV